MSGLEEGGIKMTIGVVVVHMVEAIQKKTFHITLDYTIYKLNATVRH